MDQEKIKKVHELTTRLNRYRDEYYNQNAPSVTDEVYDRLFDELTRLEEETGIQMANSPTLTVGYPAVSVLEKTHHAIPLLSLDKIQNDLDRLKSFIGKTGSNAITRSVPLSTFPMTVLYSPAAPGLRINWVFSAR